MGRGKVVLERIENKINRQVTFSKRRNGLLKKAYELSVLCDAEIALILFSNRGKLYEFGTTRISETLERYRRYCYTHENNSALDLEREPRTLYEELTNLKAKYESLQQQQRRFLGENLGPLDAKELQNLEKQLDGTLSKARQRKTAMMFEQIEALRQKEQDLEEEKRQLKAKLGEEEHVRAIQNLRFTRLTTDDNEIQSNPIELEPTLQTRFGRHVVPEEAVDATTLAESSTNLPVNGF